MTNSQLQLWQAVEGCGANRVGQYALPQRPAHRRSAAPALFLFPQPRRLESRSQPLAVVGVEAREAAADVLLRAADGGLAGGLGVAGLAELAVHLRLPLLQF